MDSLKFWLLLAQGLVEIHESCISCPVHSHPSVELRTKRLTEQHFLEHIPAAGKRAEPLRKYVVCIKQRKRIETTGRDSNLDTCRLKKWGEG
jgi:hypothetical protein